MHFSTIMAAAIAIAATSANPLAARQAAATPCTTTLVQGEQFDSSQTTTLYLTTSTATDFVDCQGCSLKIENIGGVGPVRIITATVIDYETTTTTTVCSPTAASSVL